VAVRTARTLLGVTPGAFVEFGPTVLVVILVLAPACLLVGFLFGLGTRLTVERGGSAGQGYAWESVGGVAGGALFAFLFSRVLDPVQTVLLAGAGTLALAAVLWPVSPRRLWLAPLCVSIICIPAALVGGGVLQLLTLGGQWPDLAFAADSPYGRLIIQARAGQLAFFENGLLAFDTQGSLPELVVHLPMLAHPDPRQVLLIGGGVSGALQQLWMHPVAGVTYVELDPLLIEAARRHLPPAGAAALDDPRLELVLADGRQFVRTTGHTYDVVILDLPAPSTGALNRFYTREFFAEVRAILNPGGVFALGLPSAENYWSPALAQRNASVYQTLRSVFPYTLAIPGEQSFFLASPASLPGDAAVLKERLIARHLETRLVTPAYLDYLFTTDRFAQETRRLEAQPGVRINADLAPICYFYELALWLERFYPSLGAVFARAGRASWWWAALPLAAAVLWGRWRRGTAVPLAIAGLGLANMTLAVLILFAYQVLAGTVYAGVSLVVTASMAGLASGGFAGNRLATRGRVADCRTRPVLIALQGGEAGCGGILWLALALPAAPPASTFTALALLVGFLTGLAFPLAVQRVPGGAGRAASTLYAADLAGSCIGAGLCAALWLPLLGIPQTCALVALVCLAGWLVLV